MTLTDHPESMQEVGRPAVPEIPPVVSQRLRRGRMSMMRDAPNRRLCVRFERGESYWYNDPKLGLLQQPTTTASTGGGKLPWRVRNKYNFIRPIITAKVSAATQRTPAFEVVPSTSDPQMASAAQLAQKVALAGYEKWRLHDVDVQITFNAIGGGGEGFAVPYFDPNVGPYHEVGDEETGETRLVGEGELKVVVLNGNQCYWEDGAGFMESRWHAIERATVIEDIEEMPGFFGEKITPDASMSDIPTDSRPDNMAMKTEYFERPCPKYPEGRHIVIVNGRQVVPERQYPLRDKQGTVIDEPVPHRLAWDLDDGSKRELGLTWQLIDAQRTAQDCRNKQVEWKNRCLMPQWWVRGGARSRMTDEPGAQFPYEGDEPPKMVDVPPMPDALERLFQSARQDMREIGFATQIEASPDVAAKTIQAAVEHSDLQWAQFLISKADFWSRFMRHCLQLVANHYSEERLLKYRGRDGWERVSDFEGAKLMDEEDVRVSPASLVVLTRAQVRDMLNWIAQTFPGWLNPQDALAALDTGSLERLMASYWLDVARANNVIQKIRDGSVMEMPTRGNTNPLTGEPEIDPQTGEPSGVPGYMPSEQDNLQIWERVFADWMKTDDYAEQDPAMQEVGQQVWDGIQQLKLMKAQREAMQQTQMAEQLGMQNATKPAEPKPMPSLPAPQ